MGGNLVPPDLIDGGVALHYHKLTSPNSNLASRLAGPDLEFGLIRPRVATRDSQSAARSAWSVRVRAAVPPFSIAREGFAP